MNISSQARRTRSRIHHNHWHGFLPIVYSFILLSSTFTEDFFMRNQCTKKRHTNRLGWLDQRCTRKSVKVEQN